MLHPQQEVLVSSPRSSAVRSPFQSIPSPSLLLPINATRTIECSFFPKEDMKAVPAPAACQSFFCQRRPVALQGFLPPFPQTVVRLSHPKLTVYNNAGPLTWKDFLSLFLDAETFLPLPVRQKSALFSRDGMLFRAPRRQDFFCALPVSASDFFALLQPVVFLNDPRRIPPSLLVLRCPAFFLGFFRVRFFCRPLFPQDSPAEFFLFHTLLFPR